MQNVTVIWPNGRIGKYGPTFRDANGRLIAPLTDYVQEKTGAIFEEEKSPTGYRSQMDAMVNALTHFAEYLAEVGIDWQDSSASGGLNLAGNGLQSRGCSDDPPSWSWNERQPHHWLNVSGGTLLAFRKHEVARVSANPISKGDGEKIHETVNRKLIQIYDFFVWSQNEAHYAANLIGWDDGFQIRSRLTGSADDMKVPFSERYPACFCTPSARPVAAYEQHWATPDEINALTTYFFEHSHPLVAERDLLVLKLGQHVAWRAGSVSSLNIDQFSDQELDEQMRQGRDDFLVTPPVQKNGHQFAFRVPWSLALQINAYVYDGTSKDFSGALTSRLTAEVTRPLGGRAKLVNASGKSGLNGEGRIFLTSDDAKPLEAHAIVKRFASAFKAIGAPKGSGYHSLRRGCADEFADTTLEQRRRRGASTAREDIEQDLIELLGHSGTTAYHAYIRASRRSLKQTVEQRQHDALVAASIENMQLMSRLAYQDDAAKKYKQKKKRS